MRSMAQLTRDLRNDFVKAQARGLNRTAAAARTQTVREVSADLRIRQKMVRAATSVTRAQPQKLQASIRVSGKRIPIHEFNARQTRKGVTYRSRSGRKLILHGFIARMPSGHTGVFKRFGNKVKMTRGRFQGQRRQPIVELLGPSIPKVFTRARIQKSIRRVITQRLDREIDQAFSFFARRRLSI